MTNRVGKCIIIIDRYAVCQSTLFPKDRLNLFSGRKTLNISKNIFYEITAAVGGSETFSIILAVVFFLVGMVMLVKGADMFVDGAAKTALKLKVPMIVIGLTIVAFGTSAPEAAISINAACRGEGALSLGNIIGSNTLNILLILGICALVTALPVSGRTFAAEIPFVVVITAVLLLLGADGNIGTVDSIILLALFAVFIVYLIIVSVKSRNKDDENDGKATIVLTSKDTALKLILFIIFGIAFVVVGSDLTVTGAKVIAYSVGVDPRIIGLTAAAFGTSLPELVTGIAAARKKAADLAIGEIIGSNVFNILFAGGLAGILSPMPVKFKPLLLIDCGVAVFAAVLLWLCLIKNRSLGKKAGITMIACYSIYFIYLIIQPSIFVL